MGFSKSLGKALGTMDPERAKKTADFINDQSDEFMATALPELTQTTGKGGGGLNRVLRKRDAFDKDALRDKGIRLNDRIVQYRETFKNIPPEIRRGTTPAERDAQRMINDLGSAAQPPRQPRTPRQRNDRRDAHDVADSFMGNPPRGG
jgi:hypothetical protein